MYLFDYILQFQFQVFIFFGKLDIDFFEFFLIVVDYICQFRKALYGCFDFFGSCFELSVIFFDQGNGNWFVKGGGSVKGEYFCSGNIVYYLLDCIGDGLGGQVVLVFIIQYVYVDVVLIGSGAKVDFYLFDGLFVVIEVVLVQGVICVLGGVFNYLQFVQSDMFLGVGGYLQLYGNVVLFNNRKEGCIDDFFVNSVVGNDQKADQDSDGKKFVVYDKFQGRLIEFVVYLVYSLFKGLLYFVGVVVWVEGFIVGYVSR